MEKYKSYLILHNISKRNNITAIINSAIAFGCQAIIVVQKKNKKQEIIDSFPEIQTLYFQNLEEIKFFCSENGVSICGIEITNTSLPVHTMPFKGSTAFMMGNEGTGLSTRQREFCDYFIYIAQYKSVTHSLNVAVAGSIVLQWFAV